MSVMLVGARGEVATALVRRLIAEGDEVRVIEDSPDRSESWRDLGAHVARGEASDEDLLERAGQNVRTIVAFDPAPDSLDAVLTACGGARIGRVVVCSASVEPHIERRLAASGLEYVYLTTGRVGLLRKRIDDDLVAEAIDAADDIGGEPQMVLELKDEKAWERLGLTPPGTPRGSEGPS